MIQTNVQTNIKTRKNIKAADPQQLTETISTILPARKRSMALLLISMLRVD